MPDYRKRSAGLSLDDLNVVSLFQSSSQACQRQAHSGPPAFHKTPQCCVSHQHLLFHPLLPLPLLILLRDQLLLPALGKCDEDHGKEEDEDEEAGHSKDEADDQGGCVGLPVELLL